MSWLRQYRDLLGMTLRIYRDEAWFLVMINVALAFGLVLGLGYIVPDINETTAIYLTTGTATQMIVTVGLVGLPQYLAQAKAEGRLEYFFTLPISREGYLLAQVTFVAMLALPAAVFAILLGAWNYDFGLSLSPWLPLAVLLATLSLAGVGVALALLSPHQMLTNAVTQLVIFYVLFFAPVLVPREQLPWLLRHAADVLPPGYAADAVRATVTDVPGTHLGRSLAVMAVYAATTLGLAALTVRRRG